MAAPRRVADGVHVVPDYPPHALKRQWKVMADGALIGYVYETSARGHYRVNARDAEGRVLDDFYVGRVTVAHAARQLTGGAS